MLTRLIFRNGFRNTSCRRPIKMSPLCQLEMALPGGFRGVLMSDGVQPSLWLREAKPARSKLAVSAIADFDGRLVVGQLSTIQ